jgi:hypothetical protein
MPIPSHPSRNCQWALQQRPTHYDFRVTDNRNGLTAEIEQPFRKVAVWVDFTLFSANAERILVFG